ncbi:MAG: hydroxyacid dehydrogenase, partial [Opitutaceae bacterium]
MDFFFQLPLWLQAAIKGCAAIAVMIPMAGACSMAERKVCAWIQGRPGPNRAIVPLVAGIPFLGRFLQR